MPKILSIESAFSLRYTVVNTHKDVFAQLAKYSNNAISPAISERLNMFAGADEIASCDMAKLVQDCVAEHLSSDNAVKVLDRVLFSLQREEIEYRM